MKPVLIAVSLLLFFSLSGQAQSNTYYAILKGGQKIYSRHLSLRINAAADQYLLLDSNRHIPIEDVDRFHSSTGTFVTVPGSAGTDVYRIEREGPKITLYSRLFFDPTLQNDSGYTPTREFYFRKAEQEKMKVVTLTSLRAAVADNPASLHQVNVASKNMTIGLTTGFASVFLEAVGIYFTAKGHTHPAIYQPTVPPGYPPLPPIQTTVTTHPVSPLVYIGGGGMVGGLILAFGAQHHALKAFDIYNQ